MRFASGFSFSLTFRNNYRIAAYFFLMHRVIWQNCCNNAHKVKDLCSDKTEAVGLQIIFLSNFCQNYNFFQLGTVWTCFYLALTLPMFSHFALDQINILQAPRQMKERNNWLILTLFENKIRKIYKFAFHVEQHHNINYLMGWGLKTIYSVDALTLS